MQLLIAWEKPCWALPTLNFKVKVEDFCGLDSRSPEGIPEASAESEGEREGSCN